MTLKRRLSCVATVVLFVSVLSLASGCGVRPIPIPPYTPPPNVSLSPNAKLQPVGFDSLVFDLERGRVVGAKHVGYSEVGINICNYHSDIMLYWTTGRAIFGDMTTDFSEAFYDALHSEGYNVAGDPAKVYNVQDEQGKAVYRVSGRVTSLTLNVCMHHDIWVGRYQGQGECEADMEVEWSVFDTVTEKVVLKVPTRGYQKADQASSTPELVGVINAFYGAAQELANNKQFYDLVSKKVDSRSMARADAEVVGDGEKGPLILPYVPLSRENLREDPERFRRSAVLIRTGGWHGSGFLVSEDGYILTNAHVVGDNDEVSVAFYGGFEMQGKVLRRHKTRDVALVKVDVHKALPLAIRREPVRVAETVYAIGAPKLTDLAWTLTMGVVSAVRKDEKTGLNRIQADVETHGGNSGGPLLDERGNLVGITVSGLMVNPEHFGQGLNFFIPIQDALKKLDLHLAPEEDG